MIASEPTKDYREEDARLATVLAWWRAFWKEASDEERGWALVQLKRAIPESAPWIDRRPSNSTVSETSIPAANRIRQALRERGLSVPRWAKRRGYPARSVYSAIKTWAHRKDRAPLGGVTARIMADLADDLGDEVVTTPRKAA